MGEMWLERDTDLHVVEFCDITANIRAKFLNTQNESSCQSYRTGYWKMNTETLSHNSSRESQ